MIIIFQCSEVVGWAY